MFLRRFILLTFIVLYLLGIYNNAHNIILSSPLQQGLDPILAENVSHLRPIFRLGDGFISDITWSPDGKTLAISSNAGVHLYDEDGHLLDWQLPAEVNSYTAVSYNLKGDKIITGSGLIVAGVPETYLVKFWNSSTGELIYTLDEFFDPITNLQIEGSEQFLFVTTSGDNQSIHVLDITLGKQVLNFEDVSTYPSLNPIRSEIAIATKSGIEIWDYKQQKLVISLPYDQEAIKLSYSYDGNLVAGISANQELTLWDIASASVVVQFPAKDHIIFAPTQNRLAYVGMDDTVQIYDVNQQIVTDKQAFKPVVRLRFKPNSSILTMVGPTEKIILWDIEQNKTKNYLWGGYYPVNKLAVNRDGSLLAVGTVVPIWDHPSGRRNVLRVWNLESYQVDRVNSFIQMWQVFPWWDANDELHIWGIDEYPSEAVLFLDPRKKKISLNDMVTGLQPNQSGDFIIVGVGSELKFIDPTTYDEVYSAVIRQRANPGFTLLSESIIALSLKEGTVSIWDLENEVEIHQLALNQEYISGVTTIAFNEKRNLLAISDGNGYIYLWDLSNYEQIGTLSGIAPNNVVFNRDGSLLAVGDAEGILRVWDTQNLTELFTTRAHFSSISDILFTPSETLLICGASDGTVSLWAIGDEEIQNK